LIRDRRTSGGQFAQGVAHHVDQCEQVGKVPLKQALVVGYKGDGVIGFLGDSPRRMNPSGCTSRRHSTVNGTLCASTKLMRNRSGDLRTAPRTRCWSAAASASGQNCQRLLPTNWSEGTLRSVAIAELHPRMMPSGDAMTRWTSCVEAR